MSETVIKGSAVLSSCGTYRYELHRTWDRALGRVAWIMLNPSTADATVDDPTIRRCVGFARTWGYGGIVVRNLFALRATNPKGLRRVEDPIGPYNDAYLYSGADADALTVCAWGAHGRYLDRQAQVLELLRHRPLHHLSTGLTSGGSPKHPLYLRNDTALTRWEP